MDKELDTEEDKELDTEEDKELDTEVACQKNKKQIFKLGHFKALIVVELTMEETVVDSYIWGQDQSTDHFQDM